MSAEHVVEPEHAADGHADHPATDHPATDHPANGKHGHGLTDSGYVKVAAVLAFMTGLEVALSYSGFPGVIFMPALLILMTLKFVTVVSFFMHLRFDNKIFTWLFYTGLLLAVFVYCVALATFHFFNPS